MLPYKPQDINCLEDVKNFFPLTFDCELINKGVVKSFTKEELNDLVDTAHDNAIYSEKVPRPDSSYERVYKPVAQARGLYKYLWCRDFIAEQMISWGWNHKDLDLLIKRMEKTGYDPYSTSEPTAGRFIESLQGYGYKKIETKQGDEYYIYNPKGYEKQVEDEKSAVETWMPIKSYPNYAVSNLGQVRSVKKECLMKLRERYDGYFSVRLYKNGSGKECKIHRLVAEAFISNPENKAQVNHISGNKKDNRVCNLEWVSCKENHEHAMIIGLKKHINEYV